MHILVMDSNLIKQVEILEEKSKSERKGEMTCAAHLKNVPHVNCMGLSPIIPLFL